MTFVELIKEKKMGNEEGEIFQFPHHATNNTTTPQTDNIEGKSFSVMHCAHCRYFRSVLSLYTPYYLPGLRPFTSRIAIHTYSFLFVLAVTVPTI